MALDPLTSAFELGTKLIDRFFPDPSKKAEAMLELTKLQQNGDLAAMAGQTDVNKIEAGSASMFVAGWRPFVGWVCASGLAVQFIVRPLFIWGAGLAGHPTDFPGLDMGTLMTLLTGMLGFGAMRTYEKLQGAAGNH